MMGCAPWVSPCKGSMENCITLDKMVIAPTAKSPPYFWREALKQTEITPSVDCITNGDMPKAKQGA